VIPNEKLASDTIRNSTLVSREKLAQVTVQVPLDSDLDAVVDLLKNETAGDSRSDVLVTGLNGSANVTVRTWAPDAADIERIESDLRLRVLRRLREQRLL
jgi:small-conductance mechanosensitive channel